MKQWFGEHKPKEDEDERVERRLRYAVVGALDVYGGNVGVVEDIVSEAHYDWSIVNE